MQIFTNAFIAFKTLNGLIVLAAKIHLMSNKYNYEKIMKYILSFMLK